MGIPTVSLFVLIKMQNLSSAFASIFPFSCSFAVGVFYKWEKWKWQSLILESRRESSKARQGHPSPKKHKLRALHTQLFHLKSKLPVYSRNNIHFVPFPSFSFKNIMQTNQTYYIILRQNQGEDRISNGLGL